MSTVPFISNYSTATRAKWVAALQSHLSDQVVLDYADCSAAQKYTAEVAIVAEPDPQQLLCLPNLVWVQSLWAGIENILSWDELSHISVVRLVDPGLTTRMSEAVLAWSLFLHRDMPTYRRYQSEAIWQAQKYVDASDRCIAVLGCGELGLAAVKRLQDNQFDVCAWSRTEKTLDSTRHYHGEHGLSEILSIADIVVCLLPLTDLTNKLLNAATLSGVKHQASIINFGRGPIIDTQALINSLNSGQLAHAVLDVFDTEPLPVQSSLWSHPNVSVLPHISAQTNIKTASKVAAENVAGWFVSGTTPEFVNRYRGY